jgi:hypothetical protein
MITSEDFLTAPFSGKRFSPEERQALCLYDVIGRAVDMGDMTPEEARDFYCEHVVKIIGERALDMHISFMPMDGTPGSRYSPDNDPQ